MLGLEENTGLVIQPEEGHCTVVGIGAIEIVRNGTTVRYNSKEEFAVAEVGDWQLPDEHTGIPEAIWQEALRAVQANKAENDSEASGPSTTLVALANARAAARDAKDWAEADRIRDELEAHGWQVNDTPNGPQLRRLDE